MAREAPCFRLLPTVLLATTLISGPLVAQVESGGMAPGGEAGRRGMGMGEGRRPSFDPVVVEGPPSPEHVDSIMALDPDQKTRYSTLYQSLMASTKSERDQMRQARESFQSGDADPEARRRLREGMRGNMEALAARQRSFDEALKEFLTKPQLKQYDDWRNARRKEMRGRFGRPGGPPEGGRPPR